MGAKARAERKRGGRGVTALDEGLKAKKVFAAMGLTYGEVGRAAGLYKSTVSQMVNRDIWPLQKPREVIEEAVEALLKEKGATAEQLKGLWEWSDNVSATRRNELNGNGKASRRIMEVRMIDLECMKHFGLERNPFPKKISKADDFFWSPLFKRVFDTVLKGIADHEFLCVMGESGSGKTTLRIMIEQHLKHDPRVRFVAPFDLERERMRPHAMAEALIRDLEPGARLPISREARYRLARRTVADHARQGVTVVLQIEEAHAMKDESLKSLKRIIEMGGGFESILSVVLYAQPEILSEKFSYGNLSLREVALRCMVIPLAGIYKEVEKYLAWKIEKAGGNIDNIFTSDALRAMKKRLKPSVNAPMIDTPLQIHALAANAMMKALETSEPKVTAEVINGLDRWWFTG